MGVKCFCTSYSTQSELFWRSTDTLLKLFPPGTSDCIPFHIPLHQQGAKDPRASG